MVVSGKQVNTGGCQLFKDCFSLSFFFFFQSPWQVSCLVCLCIYLSVCLFTMCMYSCTCIIFFIYLLMNLTISCISLLRFHFLIFYAYHVIIDLLLSLMLLLLVILIIFIALFSIINFIVIMIIFIIALLLLLSSFCLFFFLCVNDFVRECLTVVADCIASLPSMQF